MIARRLQECGHSILRGGWPDLLVIDPTGKIFALEVKSPVDKLTEIQKKVHAILNEVGLNVFVARLNSHHHRGPNINENNRMISERMRLGWSQSMLARMAKVSPSLISALEGGKERASRNSIRRVATVLGIPFTEFPVSERRIPSVGARFGGLARAKKLSPERRQQIARKAAHARAKNLSAAERSRIAAMGGRAKAKNQKEKS